MQAALATERPKRERRVVRIEPKFSDDDGDFDLHQFKPGNGRSAEVSYSSGRHGPPAPKAPVQAPIVSRQPPARAQQRRPRVGP